MIKKILIAINNDFIRGIYAEVLKKEGFDVFETKERKRFMELVIKEKPDIVLVDVFPQGIGGFELLEELKKEDLTRKIPVIIFTQLEKIEERKKAIELEAKDFISTTMVSPLGVVRRIKIVLGEQRSYRISIEKNLYDAKQFIIDMKYNHNFKCSKCGAGLILYLMRDFSKGEKYFIISIICPKCG